MIQTTQPYLDKITSEHRGASKFIATVALTVQSSVDQQNILAGLPAAFDLDQAVGTQLDAVGLWVGHSRGIPVPLTGVYMTWGSGGPGWARGVWKFPFDPADGLVSLDDSTYRLLLRAVIAANHWPGTVAQVQPVLGNLFNATETPGTLLWVQDNFDMTMTFVLSGQWPSVVFEGILREGMIPLVPETVKAIYVKTSVNGAPAFAWGMNNAHGAGWGTGAWAFPL